MKYLLKKETHFKNEENTLKELIEIFLMVYGLPKKKMGGWMTENRNYCTFLSGQRSTTERVQ